MSRRSPEETTYDDKGARTSVLVRSLRQGDQDAGARLHARFAAALERFCWGYLRDAGEAEDAVQEIHCKVLATKDIPDSFRPWIYRIARNYCLNVLRAKARRMEGGALPRDSQLYVHHTGHLTRMANQEIGARVTEAMWSLDEKYREILDLRYTEGLSRKEIAKVLDIPERLVKTRLFNGIARLREEAAIGTKT